MTKLFKDKRFWGLICIIIVVFVIFMILKFIGFNFKMEGFQEDGAYTDASGNTFEYGSVNYNFAKSNTAGIAAKSNTADFAARRGQGVATGGRGGAY